MNATVTLGIVGFLIGGLAASLVEYWVHILMHRRIFLGRTHRNHHRDADNESWFKQFANYAIGSAPPLAVACAICLAAGVLPLGIGILAGAILWAAWVAYAHTLQHWRPELVFWMKLPVHHIHHEFEMSRHNYGLSVDWWDRVFGTYKPMPYTPPADRPRTFGALFRIRWF